MLRRSFLALVEKRHTVRFPLNLPVHLAFAGKRISGCTVNISTGGVLIVTDDEQSFTPGARIEGVIDWPVSDGESSVELKVWGSVAWYRERLVGMETRRHILRAARGRRTEKATEDSREAS